MRVIPKPGPDEYPPYCVIYVGLLPDDGLILSHLRTNFLRIKELISGLPEEKLYWRYADNKWTIKEMLVHLVDDERIYCYRALRYARADTTELHGFDQDEYARISGANQRSLDNIFEEYEAVRNATIALFDGLPDDAFMRKGGIDENKNKWTVRAMAYHIAGHELSHMNLIREKYLAGP
jgi:hypothetical protein